MNNMSNAELTALLKDTELTDICPFCEAHTVYRNNPEMAPVGILIEAYCDACGEKWLETYTFLDAERVTKFYWED